MPLSNYTCQIAGGCSLYVPNNATPSPYGSTGASPVSLGVSLAIPSLSVAPGTSPGNAAIRVTQGGNTWYIWASGGNVAWVNGNSPGSPGSGPSASGSRAFNVWTSGGAVNFSVT